MAILTRRNHIPAPISADVWETITARVFDGVAEKINETRKVQAGLRLALAATRGLLVHFGIAAYVVLHDQAFLDNFAHEFIEI
jgi:hypothetical protein